MTTKFHRHDTVTLGNLATTTTTTTTVTTTADVRTEMVNRTFYVDATGGNDANDGLSETSAWQTLAKVYATALVPGDRVLLKKGEHWHEQLRIPTSGDASRDILFSSYGVGANPLLDGTGVTLTGDIYIGLIYILYEDYITIDGIDIINSSKAGICGRNGNHLNIINCTTNYTITSGIMILGGDGMLVKGNTVMNARNSASGYEESISFMGVTNFEICYNEVYMTDGYADYGNEGIDCKAGCAHGTGHHNYCHDFVYPAGGAVYLDAWDETEEYIDVYCNRIENCPAGISLGAENGGTLQYINVYNNIIYNVSYTGIGMNYKVTEGYRRHIKIYHNSIYKTTANGGGGIFCNTLLLEDIDIKNNITYFLGSNIQIGTCDDTSLEEFKCDHNLSYGSHSCSIACPDCIQFDSLNDPAYPNICNNVSNSDPLFVSLVTPDFHLQAGSPAISTGSDIPDVSTLVPYDYDGVYRGSPPCKGAFEYVP